MTEIKPLEIMIVDDAQCMCHLYDFLLRRHICKLNTTLFFTQKAGSEAIGALKAGYRPDFSIIDIRINGVNGVDVWRELAARIENPHFVFLTASTSGDSDYEIAAKLVGKDKIVQKTQINFSRDLMGKIPNLNKYLKCGTCINGGDSTVCQVKIKG